MFRATIRKRFNAPLEPDTLVASPNRNTLVPLSAAQLSFSKCSPLVSPCDDTMGQNTKPTNASCEWLHRCCHHPQIFCQCWQLTILTPICEKDYSLRICQQQQTINLQWVHQGRRKIYPKKGPEFLRHISRDSREKFISWPAVEVHCPTIGVTFPVAAQVSKIGKNIGDFWIVQILG